MTPHRTGWEQKSRFHLSLSHFWFLRVITWDLSFRKTPSSKSHIKENKISTRWSFFVQGTIMTLLINLICWQDKITFLWTSSCLHFHLNLDQVYSCHGDAGGRWLLSGPCSGVVSFWYFHCGSVVSSCTY